MANQETKFHGFNAALGFLVVHLGLIPGILVVAGVDDQDVAFFDFHFLDMIISGV